MMTFLGDFAPGETVNGFYATYTTAGASVTRSTDGTLSVYKDNSDTQTTTGVTSGEDTDGLTGIHRFTIATTDSFYTPGSTFFVILSGATVDSASVAAPVGCFTIGKSGCLRRGTAQSATASTVVLDAAAALGDDIVIGSVIQITGGTGIHQSRIVTDYVTATDTATVSPDWTTTPDSTSTFALWASPPAPTSVAGIPSVNVTYAAGTAWGSGAITAASIASDAITAAKIADGAIDAATFAAGAINAAAIAADAITAAKIATDAIGSDELATGAVTKILTTAMTEAYAADGATNTVAQALYFLIAALSEFSVSGTTVTLKKLDGSTTAATLTLGDASDPTSITRAS